jgi:monofunctional glycosyltransferase
VARKRFRLFRLCAYLLGIVALAVIAIQVWFYAHILYYAHQAPGTTAFMERYLEKPNARLRYTWVPYERISPHVKRAVVAAEDAKFLDHEGFDWDAIQKAIEKNEKRGKVVAGASTISQQLAKNLFLSGSRSMGRKAEEAVITWMLERTLSKRRILELYLNVAEWGEGIYGAEAAARHHFNVPAAAVTPEQAAWLAAILPSPRRYERGRETPYIAGRMVTISSRMTGAQIP